MKSFLLVITGVLILASCQFKSSKTEGQKTDEMIQTASGLQYYYLKKGDGPKVEPGCRVGTHLSLKVKDSVVWNTNELPDSLFTFVADSTRLIKGFTEVSLLLREGDEIVAILPDSLAYGAKGAGDVIPPHATLVYDVFKVVKVEPPYSKSDSVKGVN
jgi:FKBP-type peptidyl-prolyl cis-trans isomerase